MKKESLPNIFGSLFIIASVLCDKIEELKDKINDEPEALSKISSYELALLAERIKSLKGNAWNLLGQSSDYEFLKDGIFVDANANGFTEKFLKPVIVETLDYCTLNDGNKFVDRLCGFIQKFKIEED